MSKSKADAFTAARARIRQKEFADLSALLWGALRRRAWQSGGEIVRAIAAVFDQMPIDFMKGAVELTRRRFTPDRICKFLRQVQVIQDRHHLENRLVQTKFYRAFIVLEVVFHLCRMGYLSQAYENIKSAAGQSQFTSMALFHSYTGIIGIEYIKTADHLDSAEIQTVLHDSVAALRRALQMEPNCDVALLYLIDAADLGDLVDARHELEQFTARNPRNPYGHRLLFDHLKRDGTPSEALFQAGCAVVMLDPAAAAFADMVDLFAERHEPLATLCIHRLQYVWYDLVAWRTLSVLLRDLGGDVIAPPAWWLDQHYRHPRAMARELGLAFDEPEPIRTALLLVPAPDELLDALEYKTVCASYLLEHGPESRFVVETMRALIESGQMRRANRLSEMLARPRSSKRRRTARHS